MKRIELRPVDTWFFRDATPFTAEVVPQEGVQSIFPPHPPTVAGALRAAIAACNGWQGVGRWPEHLNEVLGDGPDDLGTLSFVGPLVLQNSEPLFPCPRHVLGAADASGRWVPRALLRPGPPVQCDLGDAVRLPQIVRRDGDMPKLKPPRDIWITTPGLTRVLGGALPCGTEIVRAGDLWTGEERIGLERNRDTRTAEQGMLYSTRHVRLHKGISLGLQVEGVPGHWRFPRGVLRLGGESRLAECLEWTGAVSVRQNGRRVRGVFAVVALTPLDLEWSRGTFDGLALAGAQVVSVCAGRPLRIGGWDSLAGRPLPLRSVLAPGSVLFCEASRQATSQTVAKAPWGLHRMGARTEWGFGLVAVGAWPSKQESH